MLKLQKKNNKQLFTIITKINTIKQ
jgi:hypothetical protein